MKNTAFLLTASLLAVGCTATEKPNRSEKSEDPNVIFILIDDLSHFGTSAYGLKSIAKDRNELIISDTVSTPNIDRLAREGVMCNHAYAHALSEATRVALMTGMNNGRNYVQCKSLHDSQITFGDVFQQAGYATGMYGKWKQSRGTDEIPGEKYLSAFGWDDYACYDVVTAEQRYINPNLVVNDQIVDYNGRTDLDPRTGRRWYGPDIFNYKALDFIEANKDRPFFLYYPMALVHSDHKPTPDSADGTFDTVTESIKYNDRKYYPDMIRYTDKMIGRVIDKVEELGLRENTLIVVMGDNGSETYRFTMKDGTVHIGAKGEVKYSGEQVPLIFSMPGTIPTANGEGDQMRKYDAMTDLTDIYPTIMDAAGIDVPNADKIDGVSMWSQVTGESNDEHRDIIYKWYNMNNDMDDLSQMRRYAYNKKYKYYAPNINYPNGRFFDLVADPLEQCGAKGERISWSHYWYDGLDIDNLTSEQQAAFDELKAVVDANAYVAVESIDILGDQSKVELGVGEELSLDYSVVPSNATMTNVIWRSSNPEVAQINKFGEVVAKKAGEATITLYSWDDARPVATGSTGKSFNDQGMKDVVTIEVK